MKRTLLLVCAAVSVGCIDSSVSPADDTGSSGETVPTSTGTTEPLPGSTGIDATTAEGTTDGSGDSTTSAIAWETEGADEGYGTTGGCGFTCPQPPGPGGFGCSFSEQDCGEGETCMPWDNSGGRTWNALRCVPLDADPVGLGEPCAVEGSFLSGITTCEAGLWCGPDTAEDESTNQGTCKQLCNAGPCPDGTTCVRPGTVAVGVCEILCDPLAQDACPSGQACMPAGFGFACHITEPESVEGECDAYSHCAPGFACLEAPQCGDDGERCCRQICDMADPTCPDAQTCTDQGSPLAEYADVGFCAG